MRENTGYARSVNVRTSDKNAILTTIPRVIPQDIPWRI